MRVAQTALRTLVEDFANFLGDRKCELYEMRI